MTHITEDPYFGERVYLEIKIGLTAIGQSSNVWPLRPIFKLVSSLIRFKHGILWIWANNIGLTTLKRFGFVIVWTSMAT